MYRVVLVVSLYKAEHSKFVRCAAITTPVLDVAAFGFDDYHHVCYALSSGHTLHEQFFWRDFLFFCAHFAETVSGRSYMPKPDLIG